MRYILIGNWKKRLMILLLAVLMLTMPIETLLAQDRPVSVVVDGRELSLADPVVNQNGRVYYPFREILEGMGAAVRWTASTQSASGTIGANTVSFFVGSSQYQINGQNYSMADASAFLDSRINRVYIPIRFAAEGLGYRVEWQPGADLDRVLLTSQSPDAGLSRADTFGMGSQLIGLGQSRQQVIDTFGQPDRIDPSAYGFSWYVYNRTYENYLMVGIQDNVVKGLFSNGKNLVLRDGLGFGSTRTQVSAVYGNPGSLEFWYDPNNSDRLYAVSAFANPVTFGQQENAFISNSEVLLRTYERQCFEITNAFRVAHQRPSVDWSQEAATVALGHATDMALRNYFDHFSPEGEGPLDRMNNAGLFVQKVTENCAAGYPDAIQVLKGWVESNSHRTGMLETNSLLGVGAYYHGASQYRYYMVQNFITP